MATTTKTVFIGKMRSILHDNISGTTTSAGDADKKDLIDSSLTYYDDDYFNGWWIYVGTELRRVENFVSSTGTVEVYTAFSSQVGASTAYQLYKHDRDEYVTAANQALRQAYPRFSNLLEDTSLTGTGSSATEYTVPATFTHFPDEIWYEYEPSSGDVTYYEVTNYQKKGDSGAYYFYADIDTGEPIILRGRVELTEFTSSDTSTTELTSAQADIVAYLAASIFCRMMAASVNAKDAGRYNSLANEFKKIYDGEELQDEDKSLPSKIDWSWLGSQSSTYE